MKSTLVAVVAALAVCLPLGVVHAKDKEDKEDKGGRHKVSPLVVVDATGKTIGRFLGTDTRSGSQPMVEMTIGGAKYAALLTVPCTAAGCVWNGTLVFEQSYNVPIYFESTDCTGNGYGSPFTWVFTPSQQVAVQGRLYIYPMAATATSVRVQSYYAIGACRLADNQLNVHLIGTPIDITDLYVPPFTIQ